MSGLYSMSGGASYSGATGGDWMLDALDQPLSAFSTLEESAKGGVLDSLYLGSLLKKATIDAGAPIAANRGESPEDFFARRAAAGPITEDQYKASANYREGIPWDPAMTTTRAAALAESFDAKRARDYFTQKRPVWAFIGGLGGQAVDPINYIPVFGEGVQAAQVARFGAVGGRLLTSAADAALNTGIASVATAGERARFGDDVSWQTTLSQMAMAALVGGAFGTLHGIFRARADAGSIRGAEERLATLRTTQEARIALNEGIDAIVRGEDVNLSPNATEPLARLAREINPARSGDLFAPLDRTDLYRSTAVGRVIDSRPLQVQDFESAVRNEVLAANPDIAARYQAAEAKFKQAQDAVAAIEEPLAARRQSDSVALVDSTSADRLRAIEDELATSPNAKRAQSLQAERDIIVQSIGEPAIAKAENDFRIGPTKRAKQARKVLATARQDFGKVRREVDTIASQNATVNKLRSRVSIDTAKAKPEPTPEGLKQAEASVARPEDTKSLAAQNAVDPTTGAFTEEADIKRLASEGRLTEEDLNALNQADNDVQVANSYGEALKAVVSCLL
jgi:hypothetical protein